MKTLKFFALVGILSILLIVQPTVASRPQQNALSEFKNYVVIGAFKSHLNATRFANHASQNLNLQATFEMNSNRNLYYVYVLSTDDLVAAINEARRLRSESELVDAWVFSGAFNKSALANQPVQDAPTGDINPTTNQPIQTVTPADTNKTTPEVSVSSPVLENKSTPITAIENDVEGKAFFFKIFRATDATPIEGDVDAIDIERSKKIASYKGNVVVKVSDPSNKNDSLALVCEVFGYRKLQRVISYQTTEGEGVTVNEQGATVVPFELTRLEKGDIAVMYNVFFFKDAAIMRPESRFEVNSLMEMLNENKNYKIKIHGHTNGGASGKVISMNKESTSFFSLNDTREGYGSAKELSEERSEIIFNYLASNGIDPKRMQVKAWGGKRPIHDKLSTRAQENVRVEIEILEN